jgi:Flp pilus assembly protein TadB
MIDELKTNIRQEKLLITDIYSITSFLSKGDISEKQFYISTLKALVAQLKILNGAIPDMLDSISPVKNLVPEQQRMNDNLTKISYTSPVTKEKNLVTINKKDAKKFIEELKISHEGIKDIKEENFNKIPAEIKKSKFSTISNALFYKVSEKILPSMSDLGDDLKKANISMLTSTYISIALFSSTLILIASAVIFFILLAIGFDILFWSWTPLLSFIISIAFFYFYPSMEKGNVEKMVSQEMPFAAIHMAAIAGSNVEPTKIFRIIAASKDYPYLGAELKKIINQVEIYGYDLVTALKNTAKNTPNENLSELLSGLATNISSGGNLKDYLDKKSENFLADYRLERQKYNSLAELFMDIYISVLITGPLIMMVLFMVMNIGNFQIGGLSMDILLFLTCGIVVVANIIFLIILDIKQPKT